MSTEQSATPSPVKRARNPFLVLGIVGVLLTGVSFAGGYFATAAANQPQILPTADARPLPAEIVDPEGVRTCSISKLLRVGPLGTQTALAVDGDTGN